MDEQQTLTAEQIFADSAPYWIAALRQRSRYFREGAPPAHVIRWAVANMREITLAEAREALTKERGQQ